MTTYYFGPGGDDNNDGLTWDTRKLTLEGVENTPIKPGDIIYCSPIIDEDRVIAKRWVIVYSSLTDDIIGVTGLFDSEKDAEGYTGPHPFGCNKKVIELLQVGKWISDYLS